MRNTERFINGKKYNLLELTVYDQDDVRELSKHKDEKAVCVSMEYAAYLKQFSSLETLILTAGESSSDALEGIYSQQSVRALVIDYENDEEDGFYQIDLSRLSNVEYVFTRSSWNIRGIGSAESLRTLVIGKWAHKDMEILKGSHMDSLCILSGKLRDLSGIGELPLKLLSISYCPIGKIEPVNNISTLQCLEIEACGRIDDMELLASDSLEFLILLGRKKIPSLKFVRNLTSLRRIWLEWAVEDCDLSALDSLETAKLFTDKRGYNRKNKDLPKSSTPYDIPSIPRWRYYFADRTIY